MPSPACKITVLGSGTSVGIPTIGCHCDVCTSADPRDNRLRPSILVSYEGRNVLIDTTPDFRTQALRARIDRLDAVLFTHSHADHLMGLDDVRPFNYRQKGQIPIFAAPETMAAIQRSRSPGCGAVHALPRGSSDGPGRRASVQLPAEGTDPDLRGAGDHGGDPAMFPVYFRRRQEGIERPQTGGAGDSRRAVRSLRHGISTGADSTRQPDDLWFSLRRGGLPDGS